MTYAELHASSAFSFLDGASAPEELAKRAAELKLPAVALADAHGVYGAPRFYRACKEFGIKALVGAELPSLGVTVLVESRTGYKNLCKLLTAGASGRPKGGQAVTWEQLAAHAAGLHCLADRELERVRELFGPERAHVELQRHLRREQERRNRELVEEARRLSLPLLATNGVKYARREDKEVYDVMTSLRLGEPLDRLGGRLSANSERHLKSPARMLALFEDLPEAVEEAGRLAERLSFTLADLGYRFPDYPLPPGETPSGELRRLTWEAARERFRPLDLRTQAQLRKELDVIEKLGLAGYFLIVHDIVRFCKSESIMAQGRGSAANSAVCYALGITAVDPVRMELLFERFLSEERGEWPDIDLDLPSGEQREKVIQHLYTKYGARSAAMTANVITYRPKSAIREAAKALGYSAEQQDRLSRLVGNLSPEEVHDALPKAVAEAGLDLTEPRVQKLLRVWLKLQNLPRHLGQHSGGMVLAGGRLDEVVPLEPASMPGRVVIQWDKDDCADLGLIKVDLLGLGMLQVLEEAVALTGVDLAHLPQDDPEVYKMLNEADTVGVFQLESRAQMASLPRHKPQRFYDIVVQVAIIRPGPIVGGMVHPFFDRRRGLAPVEYPHPSLEPVLKRTLGVPLFQEQVLRMAMVAAGFTGGQAEELRRAIGFKRSAERMSEIEAALRAGLRRNGCAPAQEEQIVTLITSFALYGFPESHAASFALIAYASAWLKVRHPGAFYAALLNAWPMGFYHPATIVKDAQRRGVEVLPLDVNASGARCRMTGPRALRLGLRFVQGLSAAAAARLEAEAARAPFSSVEDAARRAELSEEELAVLAQAGAFASLGLERRQALWQAAKAARPDGPLFAGAPPDAPSPLPAMTPPEVTDADYETARLTVGPHRVAHLRGALTDFGVTSAAGLAALPHGSAVRLAGSVVVRQRPGTAKGFLFVTLEDETGLAQAIVSPALFQRQRGVLLSNGGLIVEGILQKQEGALSVKAARLWPLASAAAGASHDFR